MANIEKETTHKLTLGLQDFEAVTRNFGENYIITFTTEQLQSLKDTIDNALAQ